MKSAAHPLIILIGGASGTGKTTIARELSCRLKIAHRLGTGFIREISRCYLEKSQYPELFNFSFRPQSRISPFMNLVKQTKVMKQAIELCIKRAQREGTSLVIEGTHLIPGLIDTKFVSLFAMLYQTDIKNHKKMFLGSSHSARSVNNRDFLANRQIQKELKLIANKNGIPLIKFLNNNDATEKLLKILSNKLT